MSFIAKLFKFEENNTTYSREIVGGATTFMTMAYIIFVQPVVLSACGMDFGAVMVATCLGSAFATLVMGILANYPIALAPAMGHNFFFAYTVCIGMGISWQVALGANFVSGIIFLLFAGFAFREKIINVIPSSLKHAIAVGIGLLITFIGLQWAGIVVDAPGILVGLGDVTSKPVVLSIIGVLFIAVLMALRVKGAIFIGIIVCALIGIPLGIVKYQGVLSAPPSLLPTLGKLQVHNIFSSQFLTALFVLFFLDLFDTIGTLVGVSEKAGFIKDNKLPRAKKAFLSDAIGTVSGTMLGTSTITSYIESAAGISDGARTGFANIITAGLFIGALFFSPIVKMIGGGFALGNTVLHPVTAPALIIVGYFMITVVNKVKWDDVTESLPAFITIIIMPVTMSITEGISFGFITYCVLKVTTGKFRQVHWLIYLFSILFVLRYIFISFR